MARSKTPKATAANAVATHVANARTALQMQREGFTLWQIAQELGLTTQQTVGHIRQALNEASAFVDEGSKRELLALELDRLDALQQSHWGQAVSGDVRSAEFVLKVIDKRTKLLGLVTEDDDRATVQTVVVTGDTSAYVEALRAINTPKAIDATSHSQENTDG